VAGKDIVWGLFWLSVFDASHLATCVQEASRFAQCQGILVQQQQDGGRPGPHNDHVERLEVSIPADNVKGLNFWRKDDLPLAFLS
jgi:hypothetical protein